mmetsp:Transcript_18312/g.27184  ORF Transcript_18312/g.27184 Transcript_18312/m.27184 type:complete len:146 (+) Transcript_18312:1453-1890(+)
MLVLTAEFNFEVKLWCRLPGIMNDAFPVHTCEPRLHLLSSRSSLYQRWNMAMIRQKQKFQTIREYPDSKQHNEEIHNVNSEIRCSYHAVTSLLRKLRTLGGNALWKRPRFYEKDGHVRRGQLKDRTFQAYGRYEDDESLVFETRM